MLLQNIQLVVGKPLTKARRNRKRANRPLFSVVMDEFAPFGYQNFQPDPQHGTGNQYGISVFDAEPPSTAQGRQGV